MRRKALRILAAVALAVLALLLLVAITPQGRAAVKTVALVAEVVPGMPQPFGWLMPDADRERITYPSPFGEAEADIYRTGGDGGKPALVLFLGVNPAGRDDERVVNIASALAESGYVVLVPWSRNMVSGRVGPDDVELLVSAFQHLQTLDYVDPDRIGGGGFCVGSSLLTVAASDPRIRDDVRFINFFSGFYDGRDYLAQFAARQAFENGERRDWDPDPLTTRVFERLLVENLPNTSERETLNGHFMEDEPLTDSQVTGFSSEAQAVYGLLTGATLEEARGLIEQLPQELRDAMDALSPSQHLDGLRADLWIMHDQDDELAPVEESRRLYEATRGRPNTTYTEFSFFQHVDPSTDTDLLSLVTESWKLLQHLYRVVRLT
ncbi:MAG: hypothetical protein WD533_09240 [Dehalococcoidia bacterium]